MGLLINGKWLDQWYDTKSSDGKFIREDSQFRGWAGDTELENSSDSSWPSESGRYHLYVSLACPWAHRTLIFRKLKGLEKHISVSVVSPDMLADGWKFEIENQLEDQLYGNRYLHQLYTLARKDYSGRVTVPILWDRESKTIVNNESSEIIRMFNSGFNRLTQNRLDFYPRHLRERIDRTNAWIYDQINNGVYKTGFATSQAAYEEAFNALFAGLDRVESMLQQQAFLAGEYLTEADWRLFTTLIRFDAVYVGHFKCNSRRISDYPAISNYVRQLYQVPGVAETVNFAHIKRHYYFSHKTINPTQIVPIGPEQNYSVPHDRGAVVVYS